MKHTHEYEVINHPDPTADVKALGIKGIEIRRCKTCQKVMPFVLIKTGWIQLLEDRESDKEDILLA